MSRRSRRKTISHADLEDFLCDLGDESAVLGNAEEMEIVEVGEIDSIGTSECSMTGKEQMTDEQRVREFHKVRRWPTRSTVTMRIYCTFVCDQNPAFRSSL